MTSPLQRYFALRVKNLFNYLHDFEVGSDEASLHDFRVEMKKLKSIIKFLRSVYPKQKFKKVSHNLGIIFQHAGEIRECQLMLQWLQKNELSNLISAYFPEEMINILISSFHDKTVFYKADLKEVIDSCSKFIHNTNAILPEQYLVDLNAQMDKKLQRHLSESEWHDLRRLIKQWMYATNWVGDDEYAKIDLSFSFYNKLQETIGYWHDLQTIKDNLSQKQIYLSSELDVHKDFNKASDKLTHAIKYRERQIEEMLSNHAAAVIV
jgi:CHAD domain-containing protein